MSKRQLPRTSHPLLLFVEDGWQRALDGIRAEVEAKYAEELETAIGADRPLLVKRIEAEIDETAKRLRFTVGTMVMHIFGYRRFGLENNPLTVFRTSVYLFAPWARRLGGV